MLVNNASIQVPSPFCEAALADIRRVFEANVHTLMRLCQLAIPPMQQAKWGRILNIGSIQGLRGNAHMAPYAMTKAAVQNLTLSLARDVGSHGITVNCLAPGWIETVRNAHEFQTPEQRAQNGRRIPIGRAGKPDDLAGPALMLCSDAGRYVTGQTLYVDGGMSV